MKYKTFNIVIYEIIYYAFKLMEYKLRKVKYNTIHDQKVL